MRTKLQPVTRRRRTVPSTTCPTCTTSGSLTTRPGTSSASRSTTTAPFTLPPTPVSNIHLYTIMMTKTHSQPQANKRMSLHVFEMKVDTPVIRSCRVGQRSRHFSFSTLFRFRVRNHYGTDRLTDGKTDRLTDKTHNAAHRRPDDMYLTDCCLCVEQAQ